MTHLRLFAMLLSGCVACVMIGGCTAVQHKAITTDRLEPYQCGTITRLHTYRGVFLASQPSPEDLDQAKKGGVKTVINLRHAGEIKNFDERRFVIDLGLQYENPAWNGPDELTDAVLDQIRHLLKTVPRPILLHCSSGNRVGAVWLAYRILDDDLSWADALVESKAVGLKSPTYQEKIRQYVQRKSAAR